MIIKIPNNLHDQISIEYIPPVKFSTSYEQACDKHWQIQIEETKKKGGKLWNGQLATFRELHKKNDGSKVLYFSTYGFKDILFLEQKGREYIVNNFGLDHIITSSYCTLLLETNDNKFVFGRLPETTPWNHRIHAIGGGFNIDEREIKSLNDIKNMLLTEVQEETKFELNPNEVNLLYIDKFGIETMFLYYAKINIPADEIGKYKGDDNEFAELFAASFEELAKMDKLAPHIQEIIKYTNEIPTDS